MAKWINSLFAYTRRNKSTGEKMKKLLLVSAIAASSLMASGYKIPEQSLNSTALAGAYVSNASTADAAYFNPANMAFMSEEKHLELNMMYIHLNPVQYSGSVTGLGAPAHKSESASENFIIPQMYLVSAPLGEDKDIRIGISVNAPAGLTKRWTKAPQSYAAEEFTLKVIEVNPTLSYRIMDNLSIAGGVRFVYSEGVIKTELAPGQQSHMDLEGSSWDIGWNAALSYKPFDTWGMALTYRSNVDLTEEGGQSLVGPKTVPATVGIPLPATLAVATDVSLTDSTNIEFVYERAFWSSYDELDIRVMGQSVNPTGQPTPKNWVDSNTFRLGLTQGLGDSVDLMLGIAYDETPVPEETLGFEMPDSNAFLGSIGARWAVSEELEIGAAILYDQKQSRKIDQGNPTTSHPVNIQGEFTGASALLVSLGLGYKF